MKEDISLNELLLVLKNHFSKIILWSLLGVAVVSIYTFFFVTPQYQSTSKIVVNQTQNTGQAITNTDIQTNLNLINTYQSIIKEPIILEDVINEVGSKLSVEQLRRKVSVQTEANSLVFGITVTDENPYEASILSNAIALSFESKIGNILEVESVTILSQAMPNLNAVSPNTLLNLILGLLLGLIIGVSTAFVSEFLDKRVKDTDIIENLGWINLGSVLEMSSREVNETRINKDLRIQRNHSSNVRRV